MSDYYAPTEDRWLSDSIIHAGQMMLKEAFPMIGGFQPLSLRQRTCTNFKCGIKSLDNGLNNCLLLWRGQYF